MRYLYFADKLSQRSFNGGALLEQSDIEASNNLLGFQFGGQRTWQWKCLELAADVKAGLMLNFSAQQMHNSNQLNAVQSLDVDQDNTNLAGIIQSGWRGRYPISDSIELEGGYRVMVVSGLALAPEQIGFLGSAARNNTPVNNANLGGDVNDSGVVILQGLHAGFSVKF